MVFKRILSCLSRGWMGVGGGVGDWEGVSDGGWGVGSLNFNTNTLKNESEHKIKNLAFFYSERASSCSKT